MTSIGIETHSGTPIIWKDVRIISFTRSFRMRFPGLGGGLVWNRPASVWVQTADGQERVIPIKDPTFWIIMALFSATLAVWLVTIIVQKRRKRDG